MSLTAIVKPTHDCNLSCVYCYVPSSAERGRMTRETLRNTMEQVAQNSEDKKVHFIWHGGEALINGSRFLSRGCNYI